MPNAPDVLRPRAAPLLAWMADVDMETSFPQWTERLVIIRRPLRERDVLARVIVDADSPCCGGAGVEEMAIAALRDLHAKGEGT